MADSHFGLIGRGLGVLAAASLLAGVSLEAAAYGSKGAIFLETGKTLSNFNFVYEGPKGTIQQDFALIKGCTVELDGSDPKLVSLAALRSGTLGTLGYMATSVGVYDGPQGTACGRVSQPRTEALQLALDPGLADLTKTLTETGANAFDRLELDVELKSDVRLRLDITFGTRVVSYYLESGAAVGTSPVDVPQERVKRCEIASDSGPDAGPSDNCLWVVDELGKSFRITPEMGEFSLEGGGDYADVKSNRTAIYLTEADGVYDCGDTVDVESGDFACTITRLNPGDGSACKAVPYVLRSNGSSCELTVDPQGQQMVANLWVKYDPESTASLTDDSTGTAGLLSTSWPNVPLSLVSFATNPGVTYPIPACVGATIKDVLPPTGLLLTIDPIPEIDSGEDRVPSSISENDFIEYACAIERHESFRTDSSGNLKLWVEELIQFWGDIKFERF
jgi:hypothetical protein